MVRVRGRQGRGRGRGTDDPVHTKVEVAIRERLVHLAQTT